MCDFYAGICALENSMKAGRKPKGIAERVAEKLLLRIMNLLWMVV